MIFNEKPNNVLMSVTCRPEERCPTVLLAVYVCTNSDCILSCLEIICMYSLHQHSIHLFWGQLLLRILILRVVFVVTIVLCFSHLIQSLS